MRINGEINTRTPEGRQKALEAIQGSKPSKFRNKPVKNDLGSFDSKHEAKWADTLTGWKNAGIIKDLVLEKKDLRFDIVFNDVKICVYEADAIFEVTYELMILSKKGPYKARVGEKIVLDAKGVLTPAYRLKKKMMKAAHGISILEV